MHRGEVGFYFDFDENEHNETWFTKMQKKNTK